MSVASSWHSKIVPFHQRLIIRDIPTKTARLRWCTVYTILFTFFHDCDIERDHMKGSDPLDGVV